MNERKVVAASLIVDFYTNVTLLNHHFCLYKNLLIEFENKHGNTPDSKEIEDTERQVLQTMIQNYRYYANKSFIQYKALVKQKILKEKEELKEEYKNLNSPKNFIVESQQAEKFLTEMMGLFVEGILKDLLNTSQTIFNQIYGSQQEQPKESED